MENHTAKKRNELLLEITAWMDGKTPRTKESLTLQFHFYNDHKQAKLMYNNGSQGKNYLCRGSEWGSSKEVEGFGVPPVFCFLIWGLRLRFPL